VNKEEKKHKMSGRAFLESVSVSEFDKTQKQGNHDNHKIIVFESHEKIRNAMQILIDNNIYSAPVWNKEEKQFIGMLDLMDILCFFEKVFKETEVLGEGFLALFEQVNRFATEDVAHCADLSKNNPFVAVGDNENLLQVVELLSRPAVHRVNVFSAEGLLENVITQSAVIELLSKNIDKLAVAHKTIEELNIGTVPVVSVDINMRTIDAFITMADKKLYSIPVVNHSLNNALVTNLSVKDSRSVLLDPTHLHLIYKPLREFITELHSEDINIRSPSITISSHDSLGLALKKFVVNKIHRVYVLHADGSPARVISLTDILNVIVNH